MIAAGVAIVVCDQASKIVVGIKKLEDRGVAVGKKEDEETKY